MSLLFYKLIWAIECVGKRCLLKSFKQLQIQINDVTVVGSVTITQCWELISSAGRSKFRLQSKSCYCKYIASKNYTSSVSRLVGGTLESNLASDAVEGNPLFACCAPRGFPRITLDRSGNQKRPCFHATALLHPFNLARPVSVPPFLSSKRFLYGRIHEGSLLFDPLSPRGCSSIDL